MEWKDVERNWTEYKDRVQDRWDQLTADELNQIGGSYNEMVGKLQEKYGITQQQAERELEEFQSTC
jgi:uncharacterized protein YjbJ (UPF0337 family)